MANFACAGVRLWRFHLPTLRNFVVIVADRGKYFFAVIFSLAVDLKIFSLCKISLMYKLYFHTLCLMPRHAAWHTRLILFCRQLRASRFQHFSGFAHCVSQLPSRAESLVVASTHEYVIRASTYCQHLRCLWKVCHIYVYCGSCSDRVSNRTSSHTARLCSGGHRLAYTLCKCIVHAVVLDWF